jgi:hypothetical protein
MPDECENIWLGFWHSATQRIIYSSTQLCHSDTGWESSISSLYDIIRSQMLPNHATSITVPFWSIEQSRITAPSAMSGNWFMSRVTEPCVKMVHRVWENMPKLSYLKAENIENSPRNVEKFWSCHGSQASVSNSPIVSNWSIMSWSRRCVQLIEMLQYIVISQCRRLLRNIFRLSGRSPFSHNIRLDQR